MEGEQLGRSVDRAAGRIGRPVERCRRVFTLRIGEGVRIGKHIVEVRRVGHRPQLAVCGPMLNDLLDVYPDWERAIDDATVRVLFAAPAALKLGVRGRISEQQVRPIHRPETVGSSDADGEARGDFTSPSAS